MAENEYIIRCWNCLGEFDALSAVWCSCNPNRPTKVCPFCLQCFCEAPEEYHASFWADAPEALVKDREMLVNARGPLGEALIKAKVITSEQLLLALKRQQNTHEKLGETLVDLGFVNQETIESFLSSQRSVRRISLKNTQLDPMLIASIGADECKRLSIIPVSRERLGNKELIMLAMANPSDGATIERIQNQTGCQILSAQCSKEEIDKHLAPLLSSRGNSPGTSDSGEIQAADRLALDLIRKAIARGASDLYIEPAEENLSVHLRIDGILFQAKSLDKTYQAPLTRQLKRLLKLDSEISDRPQEGRIVMRSGDKRYNVLALSLPTPYGENISMKIINRDTFLKTFEELGIQQRGILQLRTAMSARNGVILLSAPLFHGLTTTLYSVMKEIASNRQRKVMSIELQNICPVPGVSQISLGESRDEEATATTLKAIANSYPDVLVLADLLDSFSMSSQIVKLSGQMLVVASVEATSNIQAIRKLVEAGFPAASLSEHLKVAFNQRLVRKVCPACSHPTMLTSNTAKIIGLTPAEALDLGEVREAQGCEACSHIGYKGRVALFEVLTPSTAFRKALAKKASSKTLFKHSLKGGLVPLRQIALEAVEKGITTLEEFQKENF